MIEWWQALLIALPSSILGGIVTGGFALLVQRFQHSHDIGRLNVQLEADKASRQEQAWREHYRAQAKTLYDFIAIVERDHGRRLLQSMLEGQGGAAIQKEFAQLVRGVLDDASAKQIWLALAAADVAPEAKWQDVVKQYAGRFYAIGDRVLRDKLFELMMHVAALDKSTLTPSEVSQLILEVRARIADAIVRGERYFEEPG